MSLTVLESRIFAKTRHSNNLSVQISLNKDTKNHLSVKSLVKSVPISWGDKLDFKRGFTWLCRGSISRCFLKEKVQLQANSHIILQILKYCISFQYKNFQALLTCLLGETWSGELGSSRAHPGDRAQPMQGWLTTGRLTPDTPYTSNYVHN